MSNERKLDMGVFARYVTQNVLGMLGMSCYILADTFFISKGIGTRGLTALNLSLPVFSLINGLGLMLGMGAATRYSLSKNEKESGNYVFSQSVFLMILLSAVFLIVGIFFVSPLTSLLGADAEVFANTKVYLQVMLVFSPMFILNNIVICFVRNDGNPKLSMAGMLTGSFSNIILDYIFVIILEMGMFGAAFATGLAPIISLCILSIHFIKKQNNFKLIKVSPKIKSILDISHLGSSSLINELSGGIVIIVFNMIILSLVGNVGVAAYGVVANLSLVATSIVTGIAQGIQPMLSSANDENAKDIRKKIYKYALVTSLIISVGIYAGVYFFAEPIVQIFNKESDKAFLEYASTGLRIYFTAFIFVGFNIITAMYYNSLGIYKKSFAVSILRGFIFIIPITFILAKLLEMTGVWLAFPTAEFITALVCLGLLFKKD